MKFLIRLIIFFLIPAFSSLGSNSQKVEITITGIKSTQGRICVAIFIDNESFKKETPHKSLIINKESMKNNTLAVDLELLPGVYAISVLDDENCNGKMDYKLMGMPKEGFGFSNYYHRGLTKPHFDQFKFEVGNCKTSITVQLKYM